MNDLIIVFSISRCGSSSLEIALQNIGYKTVNVDPGRAKRDNTTKEYEQILFNIKENKPIVENVDKKYNAFILGLHGKDNITKIIQDYPTVKIIYTNRDNNSWVISMKNHQLVADRSNPKRKDLINYKNNFINSITTQIEQNKFTDNSLLFNVSNGDGYKKLCNFLHKDIPNSIYPHISTNRKLKLTQEQIDF